MKRHDNETILHGSLVKALLSIAIPVVISSFLQTMYNLTDTYWLGQIGKEQIAAINLVSPIQSIVISFGSGITVAGAIMISQYIGAGQRDEAKKMANQIFACAMIFAVLCATLCFMLTPSLVSWLGATGDTWNHSVVYLRLVILDMPFLFMINIFQAVRQAQGNTFHPMLLNLLGVSMNMILDPLLMITLQLNVAGAAIATVISKMIPAVIAVILLSKKDQPIHLQFSAMRFEKEKLLSIARIGLPTALGSSTMQFGFLLMSKSVYAFGVDAIAAYGIGNKVNGLISLPSNAIGSAVGTIVGQNMGAEQPKRAEQGYLVSMLVSVGFLLIGGMILSTKSISTAIISIFSSDAQVIAMASDFLSLMAFWCWTNGIYNCTTGLFQGTGHTEVTMAVDASRLWIFRFATLYVCQHVLGLGVRSIWLSVVLSNGISSAILLLLYFTGIWKKNRLRISAKTAKA
ncbi:MAG: MATE family efflux transporter [Clostridiales bacterium]|nr:MATE family efflux transporter [Clostridiales bacterium]